MRNSGYQFKKGYSRSKNSSDSKSTSYSSSEDDKKRVKVEKEERQREISHIQTVLSNVESQIQIKENRIEKAKAVKDFKLCDQLVGDVRALLREKRENEKQLAALNKKETKSKWYYKRKSTEKQESISAPPEKVKKESDLGVFFKKNTENDTRKNTAVEDAVLLSRDKSPQEQSSASVVINIPDDSEVNIANPDAVDSRREEIEGGSSSGGDNLMLSPSSSPIMFSQDF